MHSTWIRSTVVWAASAILATAALAQTPLGSAFTYQGRLKSNNAPLNGTADVQFMLMDSLTAGNVVAGPLEVDGLTVSSGLFTATVDFGPGAFDGNARWLQVAVRVPTGGGPFTPLFPRQPLTATPYAWALPGLVPDGNQNLGLGSGNYLAYHPADTFSYDSKTMGHYALGWFPDSWDQFGNTAWLAGYGGLKLFTNGQPQVAITQGGRVGIGTMSPAAALHVAGVGSDGVIRADSDTASALLTLTTLGQMDWHIGVDRGDSGKLKIGPTLGFGPDALTVTSAGRVGVGTTNPGWPFYVEGGTQNISMFTHNSGTDPGQQFFALWAETNAPRGTSVFGVANALTGQAVGVQGNSYSTAGVGVAGVALASTGTTLAVYGQCTSPAGYALYGNGRFAATGTKSFEIDHPLDPANRMLMHYCTEGPEPLNAYSGNVVTDATGYATVQLPDYFEELNRDFRYQLTVIDEGDGAEFVAAKVARTIQNNAFVLRTSQPNTKVSWRVEAVRNDRFVQTYGAPVEVEKTAEQRGKYLRPELYGQPAEMGIHYEVTRPVSAVSAEQ